MEYRPGKFYAAMRSRASSENEQNVFYLDTDRGTIVFKQVAGWIARRVVSWKSPGDSLVLGERIGLIRFGSRMDLWLPQDAEILVRPGQSVAGGESVVARWP
jgi:phosphatidylserine decarboxylase